VIDQDEFTCLTLWRPWANWVAMGWKPIETRLHDRFRTFIGRRIAIHAGMKWDEEALRLATPYLTEKQLDDTRWMAAYGSGGSVLCTALVKEARWLKSADSQRALIDCSMVRRFGLVLEDVRRLEHRVFVKGHQGPFKVNLPGQRSAHDPKAAEVSQAPPGSPAGLE
jgi:hypothetical protein